MKNEHDLLPCPFCGAQPKVGSLGGDGENWAVWCPDCGGTCFETSYYEPEKQTMLDKWNTRAEIAAEQKTDTEKDRVLELMAGALEELMNLMEGVMEGDYKPDSLTNQPARLALSEYEKLKGGA